MGIHVKKDSYSVEVDFSPSGDLMVRYSANVDGCEANVTKVVTDASPAIKEEWRSLIDQAELGNEEMSQFHQGVPPL